MQECHLEKQTLDLEKIWDALMIPDDSVESGSPLKAFGPETNICTMGVFCMRLPLPQEMAIASHLSFPMARK